jgi:hypothetical protein
MWGKTMISRKGSTGTDKGPFAFAFVSLRKIIKKTYSLEKIGSAAPANKRETIIREPKYAMQENQSLPNLPLCSPLPRLPSAFPRYRLLTRSF